MLRAVAAIFLIAASVAFASWMFTAKLESTTVCLARGRPINPFAPGTCASAGRYGDLERTLRSQATWQAPLGWFVLIAGVGTGGLLLVSARRSIVSSPPNRE